VGGEEFAVVVSGPEHEVVQLPSRLVEIVRHPDDDHSITVSVGAAITTPVASGSFAERVEELSLQHLLGIADSAMYASKERGGNGFTIVHGALDVR
jgi:GGDEF domain-containing protein